MGFRVDELQTRARASTCVVTVAGCLALAAENKVKQNGSWSRPFGPKVLPIS